MPPDVTVVVPVYNPGDYLGDCLDSLVGQTFPRERFEVICVDDGSTDGSAARLDEYAAAYPGLFRVVHQPNSGGPAKPCNVALDRASGRYVFFLGSDDHLAADALERMVAVADEWGSDVLGVRLVGVGGRRAQREATRETREELPFPSRELALWVSNTKLFRRDLLERHGIRYPEELRVGSDQPFTVAAMLAARKVSVLADRDYYFAVRRDDDANITFSSSWRQRLSDITAIVDHVAAAVTDAEDRDVLVWRHFHVEFARLLREDFVSLSEEEQRALAEGLAVVCATHLNDAIRSQLRPLDRIRYEAIERSDHQLLGELAGAELGRLPVRLADGRLWLGASALPGDGWLDITEDRSPRLLAAALGEAELAWDAARLTVRLRTQLRELPTDSVRLALTRSKSGENPGPRRRRVGGFSAMSAPLAFEDGRLEGSIDTTMLSKTSPGVWTVRLQFDLGDHGLAMPVVASRLPASAGPHPGQVGLECDLNGRVTILGGPRTSAPQPNHP